MNRASQLTRQGTVAISAMQKAVEDAKNEMKRRQEEELRAAGVSTDLLGTGPPPAIVPFNARPLRRRRGPAWACVKVLRENDERGPCESTVRCRFCGLEFLADGARIVQHLQHLAGDTPEESVRSESDGVALPTPSPSKLQPPASAVADSVVVQPPPSPVRPHAVRPPPSPTVSVSSVSISSAQPGPWQPSPDLLPPTPSTPFAPSPLPDTPVAPPPPPPACFADIDAAAARERELALRWIEDSELLAFYARVGVSATLAIRRARSQAEALENRAVQYPSAAHAAAAAAAAAECVSITATSAVQEWQTTDTLRLVGCQLTDVDCPRIVELMRNTGSLRELRTFSMSENHIRDPGFVYLCENAFRPPDADHAAAEAEAVADQTYGGASSGDRSRSPMVNETFVETSVPTLSRRQDSAAHSLTQQLASLGERPGLLGNRLRRFSTFRNPIGDAGIAALATALSRGAMPLLESLDLSGSALVNADGSPRATATAAATSSQSRRSETHNASGWGGRAGKEHRGFGGGGALAGGALESGIGDDGLIAFAQMLSAKNSFPTSARPGVLTRLRELRLFGNRIGDRGLASLATALCARARICQVLEELWLQQNFIGDDGMLTLVRCLFDSGTVSLRRLLLSDNLIGDLGVIAAATSLADGALSRLEKLSLSGNPFSRSAAIKLEQCLQRRSAWSAPSGGDAPPPPLETDLFFPRIE
jgi:hypothetical protein